MNADIQRYAQAMPQYREALDFLHNILDFQVALQEEIELCSHFEPATAREKWQSGQPLFTGELISIPTDMFRKALEGLCSLLPSGEAARTTLDRLLASDVMAPSNAEAWLDDLIASSTRYPKGGIDVQRLADAISADPDTLAFLVRTVLSPFFQKQAVPYREWVKTAPWRRGNCPICGSEPWMARLAYDSGRCILACPLCLTEWPFDRLRCPFCEEEGQPRLRYFTVEGDEVHRVVCHDRCQRYIKTVDERVLGRPANLLVEDIVTPHLDVLARDQGYQ
jgi:FdhE protein